MLYVHPEISCVVCSYNLPSNLLENFLIGNDFTTHNIAVYVVQGEDDNKITPTHVQTLTVPRQKIFNICRCANVGIRKAINDGSSIVVKTDIDNIFSDGVFGLVKKVSEGTGFVFRNWECDGFRGIGSPKINSRTMGTIALHKNIWEKIRGYDERMEGYGFDDYEVYQRAKQAGCDVKILSEPKMYHLSHDKHNRDTINPVNRAKNMKVVKQKWVEQTESQNWGA